jgi:hypothetical protein
MSNVDKKNMVTVSVFVNAENSNQPKLLAVKDTINARTMVNRFA